jgi:hypothetical protein
MTKPTAARGGPGKSASSTTTKLVVPVEFAVTTLRDAHDLVSRIRPASDAPASEWSAFRCRAAQISGGCELAHKPMNTELRDEQRKSPRSLHPSDYRTPFPDRMW